MTPLKERYSPAFYEHLSKALEKTVPGFRKKAFTKAIFSAGWNDKELMDRMKHTSRVLHEFLPAGYPEAVRIIRNTISELQQQGTGGAFEYIFFADYIEAFGIDHLSLSLDAMEFITQFISCEFAIRPFILKYGQPVLDRMKTWCGHESHHVRRLASEGCRPRLPWAMALPALKKDPAPILPILEALKQDTSEYVRRSVANNLNDISKDNPEVLIQIIRQWRGLGKETDQLIKHACRTLLKKGDEEVLHYFGLKEHSHVALSRFRITTPRIRIGEDLQFQILVANQHTTPQTIRLEYGLYYLRGKGQLTRKVFKMGERIWAPGEQCLIEKKQSFRLITTRRFYPGKHELSIIVNGQEKARGRFVVDE
ncbi:MAG TPA: DNA alkylation repair protein [Flavisolibacter sp.]|nr:DNA alkylation repair protein [Flavisolibacter sp.]